MEENFKCMMKPFVMVARTLGLNLNLGKNQMTVLPQPPY